MRNFPHVTPPLVFHSVQFNRFRWYLFFSSALSPPLLSLSLCQLSIFGLRVSINRQLNELITQYAFSMLHYFEDWLFHYKRDGFGFSVSWRLFSSTLAFFQSQTFTLIGIALWRLNEIPADKCFSIFLLNFDFFYKVVI